VYSLDDEQIATVVGPAGQQTVSVLHWGRDKKVIDELVLPSVPNTRFRQVDERMRTFFPGCSMTLQQIPNANAVTLGIRTSDDTDFHRPIHVGFGLTQVFPIIVAALSASKDDILMIENPEVHLHPAGQAQMGQFLAEVSASGIQVILETHSDHVLNGIRRSVKANKLKSEQAAIYFFRPRADDETQVINPQLDESGNIDSWPDGFFDQFDKDMNYFAGWGD
jgi:predicted ATPase